MEETNREIMKFTKELVRIPSQNGIDSEKKIAKLIFRKLKSFGFSPKIIGDKEHPLINGFGCDCDNVHAPNEWIDIKDLPRVFEIYKNL